MMARRSTSNVELAALMGISILLFVSVPVMRDGIGLGWDSMNHHVYLGWVAEQSRFDRDFFAAASQSYQFPYAYWPIYKMAQMGWPGWMVGCVWAIFHAFVAVPLWVMSKAFIKGENLSAGLFRVAASLFGIFNILVLKSLESTGNDVLVALPYLCALASGVGGVSFGEGNGSLSPARRAMWVGALGGASVALKLSNGVLIPLLPLVCACFSGSVSQRIKYTGFCCLGLVLGWALLYGWWGFKLWQEFGNPVFPFYDSAFDGLRQMLNWKGSGPS